jgi:type IV secretory pathway VirB2 component (pilin)
MQHDVEKTAKTIGWVAIGLRLLPLFALCAPDIAAAADLGGLSTVTDFLKGFVKLLFVDWGYYIALVAGAAIVFLAWSGRMEWIRALWFCIAVVIFFALPGIIAEFRDSASSSIL